MPNPMTGRIWLVGLCLAACDINLEPDEPAGAETDGDDAPAESTDDGSQDDDDDSQDEGESDGADDGESSSGGGQADGSTGGDDSTGGGADLPPPGGVELPEECVRQECSWTCEDIFPDSIFGLACELPAPCDWLWLEGSMPGTFECMIEALRGGAPAELMVEVDYFTDEETFDGGYNDYLYLMSEGVVVRERAYWKHEWEVDLTGSSEIFAPASIRPADDPWWDECLAEENIWCLDPENLFVQTCQPKLDVACPSRA